MEPVPDVSDDPEVPVEPPEETGVVVVVVVGGAGAIDTSVEMSASAACSMPSGSGAYPAGTALEWEYVTRFVSRVLTAVPSSYGRVDVGTTA